MVFIYEKEIKLLQGNIQALLCIHYGKQINSVNMNGLELTNEIKGIE